MLLFFANQAAASTPHFWGELDDVFRNLTSSDSDAEFASIARATMAAVRSAGAEARAEARAEEARPVSVLQLLLQLDVRIEFVY